jgi:hypothetical protein
MAFALQLTQHSFMDKLPRCGLGHTLDETTSQTANQWISLIKMCLSDVELCARQVTRYSANIEAHNVKC